MKEGCSELLENFLVLAGFLHIEDVPPQEFLPKNISR